MIVFSFRAECLSDVFEFFKATCSQGIAVAYTEMKQVENLPDFHVQFATDANLEALRAACRTVEDGHVMLQTLRQCFLPENSLMRNYGLQ